MRIFSQSLIVIACFAACAAHATDANLKIGASCSDGNIHGVWTEISNESAAYAWYVARDRIKQCHTDGPVDCFCRPKSQTDGTDVVTSNASVEDTSGATSDVTVDGNSTEQGSSGDDGEEAEKLCEEGLVRFSGIVMDDLGVEIGGVGLYIMLDGEVKRLAETEVSGEDRDNYGKFDVCVPQNTDVAFRFARNFYEPQTVQVGTDDMLDQTITMTYNGNVNGIVLTNAQLMPELGTDTESISALAKTLDAIEDAYGLSKWRTVDGKFNYARLASDATAAVVLGTTGALVTSSVVKKKQVEAGFESLECTVGGQHVGDWGDVFRIDGK